MQRHSERIVREARRMVACGMSCAEVAKKLRVQGSVIGNWCRDVPKSRFLGLIKANETKRRDLLDSEKYVVGNEKTNINLSKLMCGLLYGCEGSKYPASNGVSLVNSDPEFILAFVNLMRRSFQLDENKWRVHLQIHDDQNYQELKDYWSNLLLIPINNFYRPTITKPKGGKHRNVYYGTCSVRYGDYRLQLKLIGIFQEFLRKSAS